MKKILLATTFLAVGAAGASAADLAPRSYTKAPAAASIYNWTGFYVGGQVGGASLSPSFKDDDRFFNSIAGLNPDRTFSATGGVYGGYNWQFNSLVVGVDAQWSWYGDNSTTTFPLGTDDRDFFLATKVRDAGSVKARVGLAFENTLVYVAAGPAWANSTLSVGFGLEGASESTYRTGIAVATGVEHMFTPNWVGRGQIQYSDFGTQRLTILDEGDPFRLGQQTSIVEATVGLAYKF